MITLRDNQHEPINKAVAFFNEKKPKPSLIVLPTAWGKSILTAEVARRCEDKLIVDLGGNVDRFGHVEDIHFEQGKIWRMFGTGGRLLSGIPIHEIGNYTKEDVQKVEQGSEDTMPFGKYKGEKIANIPLNYRQWMIRSFDWNAKNESLRKAILATM